MDIRALIGQDGFWVINKKIVRHTGLEEALILSILIDKVGYFESRDMGYDDGEYSWIFWTRSQIEEETGLKYKKHSRIFKSLENLGLIHSKLMGNPAKLYYRIDEKAVLQLIQSSCSQTAQQVVPKRHNKLFPNGTTSCSQTAQLYKEEEEQKNNNKQEEQESAPEKLIKAPDVETIDIDKFVDNWNSKCVKVVKIRKMTVTREKALNRLLKEYGKPTLALAVKKFFESDFINKENLKDESSWRADFDFFIKSVNFVKVIEGKYDNLQKSAKKSNSIY